MRGDVVACDNAKRLSTLCVATTICFSCVLVSVCNSNCNVLQIYCHLQLVCLPQDITVATMAEKFPKFIPENQSLDNYWQLVKVSFKAAKIVEEYRKVSIILTHIPTKYFDNLIELICPKFVYNLKQTELKSCLNKLHV